VDHWENPQVALLVTFLVKQRTSCSAGVRAISNCGYCRFNHPALNKDGSCMFVLKISRLTCCMASSVLQMGFYC